ncbi:MAG: ceramidase domain-containing protein [Rickettsiales bacterium]|nr:ceramidase domain-containing protein [Rickettsiales bacterium]
MSDLFQAIDIYCERRMIGLWAEPLNALSNVSFLIAAWLLWRHYKSLKLHDTQCTILIGLVAKVGIGSLLFHTFANRISMLADVIPIMAFACYYLWLALRRLIRVNKLKATSLLAMFMFAGAYADKVPPQLSFNGSIAYFPCLVSILMMGAYLRTRQRPEAPLLLQAGFIFLISLGFRSSDMVLCEFLPIGVHFLWHALNGVVLYLLSKAIIINCARQ